MVLVLLTTETLPMSSLLVHTDLLINHVTYNVCLNVLHQSCTLSNFNFLPSQ